MKLKIIGLLAVLTFFSGATQAAEWRYKVITGDTKDTPGCKDKAKAEALAGGEYRFNKYTRILCQAMGYGWGRDEVLDKGKIVCDECEGDYYKGKYSCHVANIKLKCKQMTSSDD